MRNVNLQSPTSKHDARNTGVVPIQETSMEYKLEDYASKIQSPYNEQTQSIVEDQKEENKEQMGSKSKRQMFQIASQQMWFEIV